MFFIRQGSRIPGLISHIDVMPTMLELAGLFKPRGVQGQFFVPGLCGEEFEGRTWVLLEDDEADVSLLMDYNGRELR